MQPAAHKPVLPARDAASCRKRRGSHGNRAAPKIRLHGALSGGEDAGAPGEIGRDANIGEAGLFGKAGGLVQAGLVQLEGEAAALLEGAAAPGKQAAQHVKPVGAAVERERGLEFATSRGISSMTAVGTYGGLDTTRSNAPMSVGSTPSPRSHDSTSTRSPSSRAATLSRASATASGTMSVATTRASGCS